MAATHGHELLDRLQALTHRVKGRMHQAARDDVDGLAPMEARVLAHFAHHPNSTQTELAQRAGRDKAQVARIVKPLLERGLLRAEPDPADGRSLRLSLTDSGLAVHRRMHRQRVRIEATLRAALSEHEQRQLSDYIDRMLAALDREA